jgi:hypothetical protein
MRKSRHKGTHSTTWIATGCNSTQRCLTSKLKHSSVLHFAVMLCDMMALMVTAFVLIAMACCSLLLGAFWQNVLNLMSIRLISLNFSHYLVFLISHGSAKDTTYYRLDGKGVGVRVPVGSSIFISPYRPDPLWGPPSLLFLGYLGLSSQGQGNLDPLSHMSSWHSGW